VTDPKPATADVIEFVGRGVRAQCCVDAAVLGSRVGLVKVALERGDVVRATVELNELMRELARHFDRFTRSGS
jgi:hypothetical protein